MCVFSLIYTMAIAQETEPVLQFQNRELSLGQALKTVTGQTGIEFSYVETLFLKGHTITLDKDVYALSEFLDFVFKPLDVGWTRKNDLIILSKEASGRKKKVTVSGFLIDKESGERLIGGHVIDLSKTQGVTTNSYGFYSLTFQGYPQKISYSYVGYQPEALELFNHNDTSINVMLSLQPEVLEEVLVNGAVPIYEKNQMSNFTLKKNEIKAAPAFMGEVDILKTIQFLPGIQSGFEGSSGIYVRGGGPDQNLILLDGVPVYNASHLFGFFSVFNADAIQSVDLIKGGFPARYGGRLSSVIDIHTKEGNMNEFHGEGAIGNVAAKITVEGPLNKGKTSYMLSGRRTFLDLFTVPLAKLANSNRIFSYHFEDFNGKVNHIFSDKDRVFLSAYIGRDKFRDDNNRISDLGNVTEDLSEKTDLSWGNITTAVRWNHVYSPKLFGNLTTTFSRYEFNLSTEVDIKNDTGGTIENIFRRNEYKSSIRDWAAKLDFDYLPSSNHHVRFGASVILHQFEPGTSRFQSHLATDTTFGSSPVSTKEFYTYVEDDIKVSDNFSLNAGIHVSGSQAENTFYTSFQPRISTNYQITDLFSVKASFSRMAQYIHLLVNSGVGLPTDLWVPVTANVKPQRSDQVALGIATEVAGHFELTVEGYYKWMSGLIAYKDGAGFLDVDDAWEDKIETGDGYSYGVEFFLQKRFGKTTGWLGYTWSKNIRDFDNLNFGKKFYYRYDRRHDISLTLNHKLKPQIDLGLVWVYGTGFPVTLPTSTYQRSGGHITGKIAETAFIKSFPGRNSTRTKDYHRLDLSVSFSKKKKWGERKWVAGLYNAYAHLNPTFVEYDEEKEEFVQLSLFPFIPSISYQFKF